MCVHLAFKSKILNDALLMGELSYIFRSLSLCFYYNILLIHLSLCFWKITLLFLVLCAIVKSVKSLVCVLEPCSPVESWLSHSLIFVFTFLNEISFGAYVFCLTLMLFCFCLVLLEHCV